MEKIQGNIYLARVGFVESGVTKLRPVLVLNQPVGRHKIVLAAPIYSHNPDHNLIGDIEITKNFVSTGLIKPSTVRLHRMVSLTASDLIELLGSAQPETRQAIKTALKKVFNL